ncbi:ubiquinone biosynthesis O-methyltransferase, mitochondrial [Nylanderia fulva]|uniref:ubiquinone biosynthesis O-methyltransferase, mitochondrial n=1 Tax=Nylanderia fulva TaxID=613905 RepID=UPI0010FB7D70|nr:ubiquinone biosynthesis O-methyltransferase, mitochondrial [Nylanderia fulva]
MNALKTRMYFNGPSIGLQNSFSNRLLKSSNMDRIDRAISTVDSKNVEHLSKFKNIWWDENGPIKLLHSFTPLRIQFVRDGLANAGFKIQNPALPLEGVKIVDVGCGGGILTERLARIGAQVTGVDASTELIDTAKEHIKLDPTISEKVNYIQTTIEEFSPKNEKLYDAVIASEVIEHVENPELFLKECVRILKPNGSIFITTINKTSTSWLSAIVLGEYILNLLPRGTHEWNKFIAPHEIQRILDNYGCKTKLIHGIKVNPLTNQWSWASFTSINYGLHAVKQTEIKI